MQIDWNSPWMQGHLRAVRKATLQNWFGWIRWMTVLIILAILVILSVKNPSHADSSALTFMGRSCAAEPKSAQVVEPPPAPVVAEPSADDLTDTQVEAALDYTGYDEDGGILNDPAYRSQAQ